MASEKILIIGSNGQIGSALIPYLCDIYGESGIVASDIRLPRNPHYRFELLDATDGNALASLLHKHRITQVYHLAAILSAKGEADPLNTWHINTQTFFNVLEAARGARVGKVFFPSSIAVFGAHSNPDPAEQFSCLQPATAYGLSKAASENWANYYHLKYNLDVRSLRYPGIISHQSLPGGGTTDYAVDIFHKAIAGEPFTCFLREDTRLPMIYMEDALRATLRLMEASNERVRIRTSYNLAGTSFTPAEVTSEIRRFFPDFQVTYQPDFRQKIADSWPRRIDDTQAREDWGWQPLFDLPEMTRDMISNLQKKQETPVLS